MEKKEILRESIKKIVVEHEDKLNNCDDYARNITSEIISKLAIALPDIMDKIKLSNKKLKIKFVSSHSWRLSNPWNKVNQELDVPRLMLEFDVNNTESMQEYDKEVSLYEILNESIKNIIVPIMLQNYSFLVDTDRLPFAEYCVQRIDDPKFVSQISNLIYAKHLFASKGEFQLEGYLKTNKFEDYIAELLNNLYSYETNCCFNIDKLYQVRESVRKSVISTILENNEQFKQSAYNAEISIFMIITKLFNEKRQEYQFSSCSLDFNDITSYSSLLKRVEEEITALKQLNSYYSGKYFHIPYKENVSSNGFFYDNGEFARIETKEDSLIEAIKKDIKYKQFYDGKGNVIGGAKGAFSNYGWNNDPIYEVQPLTSKIVSANVSYLQNAKILLANMVISQYAKAETVAVGHPMVNDSENNKRS